MRKMALASSLLMLALLVLGVAGIHGVEEGAVPAGVVSLGLAVLASPYLAFCLALPAAHRGWTIAAWVLNGIVALVMCVIVALIPMSGFSAGSGLFLLCLAVAATTGLNLAALRRARPAAGVRADEGGGGEDGAPARLAGLRGWLLLLGAAILTAPIRIAVQFYPAYRDLIVDGTWEAVGDPDNPAYSPLWQPFIAGEAVVNTGLIVLWVFVAYLFLSKKRAFRKWFIALMVLTPLFLAVDGAMMNVVAPDAPAPDPELLKEFFRAVVVALIWVPYVLLSRRVKATFVN